MKSVKINVPEGHEIDKDKSSFEEIFFKKIESKLPLSVDEIPNRKWYIDSDGDVSIYNMEDTCVTKNHLSSESRAKAFSALIQLVELRDAWNGDWRADWTDAGDKHIIYFVDNRINETNFNAYQHVLHFRTREVRDKFLETFRDLIEEAKELL